MLKVFCDACGEPADLRTANRRFERLSGTKSGEDLGLELVVLSGGAPSSSCHVCDGCLLDLVWRMAEQCPGTNLAVRQQSLLRREEGAKVLSDTLNGKHAAVEAEAKRLKIRAEELDAREAALPEDVSKKYEEQIAVLEAQLADARATAKAVVRTAQAQARQEVADDPAYAEAVARREARRSGRG